MRAPLALCLLAATAAQAQTAGQARNEIEEDVVRAHPLSAEGLSQASLALEGEALRRNLSATLAETLAR